MIVHWNHPDPESACPICRPWIGGTYNVPVGHALADILPPPLHHHCRCSLSNEPEADEESLSPPLDWDAIPEDVRETWLAYARWMLRRHIPFPAFLLPLLALLRAEDSVGRVSNPTPSPDSPSVSQPRQRPVRFKEFAPPAPEALPMLPSTAAPTADAPRPDPDALAAPSAARVRLTGSFLPADPSVSTTQTSIPVRVLRAGRTRPIRGFPSGVLITAASLRQAIAAGLFHGVPVFFSHVLGDGRDVRDMAGVLAEAHFDEDEQSVTAALHPYTNGAGAELASLAADFRRHTASGIPAPDVGVSVDAYFSFDRHADPPTAQHLTDLLSVDIVFRPAAGGRILASADPCSLIPDPLQGETPMPDLTPIEPETGPIAAGEQPEAVPEPVPLPVAAAAAHRTASAAGILPANSADPQSPIPDPHSWLSQLRTAAINATLNNSGLPTPVRERLAAGTYDTPDELNAAIRSAREELAQLAADHVIHIGDAPPRGRVSAMRTGLEQLEQAVDWNFGVRAAAVPEPSLRSLRAIYHQLTGDFDFYGRFEPDRVHLEGATTTTLANLAANAMNKVIIQQFSALTFWRWYERIAYPTPNDGSVQDMQWTVIGGIANLPTVPEKGAYDELTVDDVAETDSFVKHGGYVPITLELFRNSDIQRIQAIPRALALAAVRTRSASVAAIFTANSGVGPTLDQDSKALFHADHGNLATTALGTTTTAWRAARTECFKHAEINSGKRLGIFPRFWLGPADLYDAALALFGYGDGVPTAYTPEAQDRGAHDPRPVPLAVPDFTDATDWAYLVDPQVFPVIHISYAQAPGGGSHPAPELFTVASPTAGLMFTNDVLPIKVRDWFAVGVNGYRGIGKRNVSG